MSFDFTKGGSAQSSESNGKSTYIFIHGPEASLDSWAKDMSGLILNAPVTRDAQILFLDWSRITGEGDGGTAPYYAASWIDSVADEASKALMEWNPNNTGTTIIGHSLGAVLGARLAARLDAGGITGQSGIKLIALDPSASVFDFRTDSNGTKFGGFGGKGLCVVADDSIAGSESLMQTCREKYLIEYDDPANNPLLESVVDFTIQEYTDADPVLKLYNYYDYIKSEKYKDLTVGQLAGKATCKVVSYIPYVGKAIEISKLCEYTFSKEDLAVRQHNWVHETYREIIRHPFYDNLLSLARLENQNGPYRIIPGINKNGINGIIYTEKEQSMKIKYLKTELKGDDVFTLIGNTQSNKFECTGARDCIVYGYTGGDEFYLQEGFNSFIVKDFKNNNDEDKLFIKGGSLDEPTKSGLPSVRVGYYIPNDFVPKTIYRTIVLEGATTEKVEGWVEIAKNGTQAAKKENPIIIE